MRRNHWTALGIQKLHYGLRKCTVGKLQEILWKKQVVYMGIKKKQHVRFGYNRPVPKRLGHRLPRTFAENNLQALRENGKPVSAVLQFANTRQVEHFHRFLTSAGETAQPKRSGVRRETSERSTAAPTYARNGTGCSDGGQGRQAEPKTAPREPPNPRSSLASLCAAHPKRGGTCRFAARP
ncbi:hypothetical protein D7X33_12370 [Butyricicoccus sp. 1XD8-22]|nr:hypothetical protein D7X33_12370 [Butyricicoccus sp. 1XD8-22]